MIHRPHPIAGMWPADDTGQVYADPDDAVLFDACERCAQHAADPLVGLDPNNLAALYRRMVAVERQPMGGPGWWPEERYRTSAEATAGRTLYSLAVFVERTQPHLDPWQWPWTVRGDRADRAHDARIEAQNPGIDIERVRAEREQR